ncbi:MAG: 4Fe-4S dicluster domain-containing protein [Candidatus Abyssobacteria bacterium SURF_5]|uniref:4Fe-4S dicluster domain-containing protein n=1 Tax=Abyssobacteria bacterium (strain SURF_5) TaxID=2093360 RepID=A0A3A4NBG9_ABYX5|nr:MAG: 4Fe-4S dicluster domain-containing protein [Candidatus Abyssubacteria bacterium SURF_5]
MRNKEDIMQQSPYKRLAERIDMNLNGAPKKDGDFSPAFLKYLELLFTPEEAVVASRLSVDPHMKSADEVALELGRTGEEVEHILSGLVEKGVVLGFGGQYMLPVVPLVVNVHQFRETVTKDTLEAGKLYQDFFIKDGFYKFYESSAAGTPLRRAIPVEQSIDTGQEVLSHEDLAMFLDHANMDAIALVPCPCRTRTERLGIRECKENNPVGHCFFIGMPAMLFVGRGEGKLITREEAKKYAADMREKGLVVMTDNAASMENGVICFCCGCCCSITRGLTRWDNPHAFARSNFVARVHEECAACGTCVDRCFFKAISVPDGADAAEVDPSRCMGCGVCTVTCPTGALRLERLEREPIFVSTAQLYSRVAAENEAAGQKRPME